MSRPTQATKLPSYCKNTRRGLAQSPDHSARFYWLLDTRRRELFFIETRKLKSSRCSWHGILDLSKPCNRVQQYTKEKKSRLQYCVVGKAKSGE